MEKRKRNRIQSSWAQQPARKTDKNDTNVKGANSKYLFQGTNRDVERTVAKPEQKITKAGKYVISSGPLGDSSIELEPNFIHSEETTWMFEQLKKEIPWQEKNIKVQGEFHKQPRLTAWFGDFSYSYSGLKLQPLQWSPLLNVIRERVFEKTGFLFNSMLANLYRDEKDSVDWHSDDEISLGEQPIICSVSFGETRNFEMRKKPDQGNDYSSSEKIKIPLPSGCMLLMAGTTQCDWQHRVPKEYHARGERINLTFRNITPCNEL